MEDPNNKAVDVDEARRWLLSHKLETGMSWPELGKLTGVHPNTLSTFASGKYQGDNDVRAASVVSYRDRMSVQKELAADRPQLPDWYDTETSTRLTGLLQMAQSGKIVLIVTGPGVGKTHTASRFAKADPNVWLATMSPASAGVGTMAAEVAMAIGLGEITGSPQQLSQRIRRHVEGKKALLIFDEAQELTEKAINEIRGWHDRTGVGIALLGNDRVVGQIEGRKSALAQIKSRFFLRHVQATPTERDLDAMMIAHGITDAGSSKFLRAIGRLPGGLREMTHTIEIALIAAFNEEQPLDVRHLKAAAAQRNVRIGSL